MESRKIELKHLVINEGQIEGLPSNPRSWKKGELENLKRSIQQTPELLEARGILVYPHDGKFVVLGGNMRLTALKALGAKDAPCIVVPEDTPVEKLKEIVIKDNGAFGDWDFDMLANEWDDLPLLEWGVPAWNPDVEEDEKEQKDEEEQKHIVKISFLSEEDTERFLAAYSDELVKMYNCQIEK